jgi:hypothetical protein
LARNAFAECPCFVCEPLTPISTASRSVMSHSTGTEEGWQRGHNGQKGKGKKSTLAHARFNPRSIEELFGRDFRAENPALFAPRNVEVKEGKTE